MCANFIEYDDQIVNKNPDFRFGDGECPAYRYTVSPDHICPENCRFYKEYTGGNE
ncbi:MAG: hypothetical protein ACOC1P_02215 [Minisyncoccales bacterium]